MGGLGDGRIEVEDIPRLFVECQSESLDIVTIAPGASRPINQLCGDLQVLEDGG